MARKRTRSRRRRKRKNPSNPALIALLVAGGGAAYYFFVHKPKQQVVIVPTAPPLPNQSLTGAIGSLLGGLLGAISSKPSVTQASENIVKATGDPAAVGKLDAARAAGKTTFAFQSYKGAPVHCIDVATGKSVGINNCPDKSFLEGMGNHSLSSGGYGSLR